jgi:hypothetical protein
MNTAAVALCKTGLGLHHIPRYVVGGILLQVNSTPFTQLVEKHEPYPLADSHVRNQVRSFLTDSDISRDHLLDLRRLYGSLSPLIAGTRSRSVKAMKSECPVNTEDVLK